MNAEKSGLQKASGKMKFLGILTIILGIIAIASPWMTGFAVLWLIGVLVMAAGIMRMIWAFGAGSLGKGILVFLIGVLTLLAGIVVISHPLMSSAVLTVVLAIYFVADGLAELFAAGGLPSGQQGKGWLIFDGIVTLILGVMLFTGFPLAGVLAIGVLLGIKLLFVGITMLTLGSAAGRIGAA
jgi:uncharacterized membrane protein HdeD (DUF308 family)